jgi:hypothetical protein
MASTGIPSKSDSDVANESKGQLRLALATRFLAHCVPADGVYFCIQESMYYPHPVIARQMRRFPILQQPWRRYVTTTDPVAKSFEKRQYRKAERAYRLMARAYQRAERPGFLFRVVHAIWDHLN